MRLGIMFGGASDEHEISIITAYQVKKALESDYEIHLIYFDLAGNYHNADKMSLKDFKNSNYKKLRKLKLAKLHLDCLIGAMHGENGEDGLGWAFARINNLKYFGTPMLASALCIDKFRSYSYLTGNGIKMVESIYYTYGDFLHNRKIDFCPCIIKPLKGGSSLGIEVVTDAKLLPVKLAKALSFSQELVIQPYLKDFVEYNLALNENSFSNLERINKKDDIFSFENKYSDAFKVIHQSLVDDELYPRFCEIARKVYDLIGAKGIIRLDFFYYEGEIYVNEINTTPGALAMYLFPDFKKVFLDSLKICLTDSQKNYQRSHFLMKNNIDK